jgi:hypothetical protein
MGATMRNRRRLAAGVGLLAAGAAAGAIVSTTLTAGAATPPTGSSSASSQAGGPGVQENDGIPEAQEHHGQALGQTGTVTAVGGDTVTIKPSTGAPTTYKVGSASDIDKNGEAQLSNLVAGDAVRFSVRTDTTTIDKLHAGDEAKDHPAGPQPGGSR